MELPTDNTTRRCPKRTVTLRVKVCILQREVNITMWVQDQTIFGKNNLAAFIWGGLDGWFKGWGL